MVKLKTVCVDGKNHGVGYSKRERVAMPQELSLDFLTSTRRRGISSRPCRLVCCAGRRVYGCKRLDSVISLPTSGIAKQHKIHTGGNGPVSLSDRKSVV